MTKIGERGEKGRGGGGEDADKIPGLPLPGWTSDDAPGCARLQMNQLAP